jgi:hypothetical protein
MKNIDQYIFLLVFDKFLVNIGLKFSASLFLHVSGN